MRPSRFHFKYNDHAYVYNKIVPSHLLGAFHVEEQNHVSWGAFENKNQQLINLLWLKGF